MRPARVYLPQGCEDTLPYVTNQTLNLVISSLAPFSPSSFLGLLGS